MYVESGPMGYSEKGSQGAAYFTAPNPPFGAVFTYYLRDALKSQKRQRQEREAQARRQGEPVRYPNWDELQREDRADGPAVILTVSDEDGNVVRRITGGTSAGIHRVAWDLRYPAFSPARRGRGSSGPMVVPGMYSVQLAQMVDGVFTPMGEPQSFQAKPLGLATLAASDKAALLAFQEKVGRLQRAVLGANRVVDETLEQLGLVESALLNTPAADASLFGQVRDLLHRLYDIDERLTGDVTQSSRAEFTAPGITQRVQRIVENFWSSSAPTTTNQQNYEIAGRAFQQVLEDLRVLVDVDMTELGERLEAIGAPWTPGRGVPNWSFE